MGYSSTRGMAALRMARTDLDKLIHQKLDPNDDLYEFLVKLSTIKGNLKIADEEGLSVATRTLWEKLHELRGDNL